MNNEGKDLNAGQAREGLELTTEQTCRICGCTDARACEGGCSWLLRGICSKCITDKVPEYIDLLVETIEELLRDTTITPKSSATRNFLITATKTAAALRQ